MVRPPGQGLLGQARAASEVRQQLRRRRWWELGPHVCVSTAFGSSVAQLVLRLRLESGLGSTTQETLAWCWASWSISGGSNVDFLEVARGLGTGLEDFVSIVSIMEVPSGLDFWACRAS